jgi:hypothetical protein
MNKTVRFTISFSYIASFSGARVISTVRKALRSVKNCKLAQIADSCAPLLGIAKDVRCISEVSCIRAATSARRDTDAQLKGSRTAIEPTSSRGG